ncbi:MAG: MarR family transcriptional regulator [Clostridium sp.]|nr:MarR family transcriptional regulator [Clostridium sp.]
MKEKDLTVESIGACGQYISYLYRRSGADLAAELKTLDLSVAQSIVLMGIFRYEGNNQKAVADALAMETSVLSRVLRELEKKGCVYKERDEENRRNYNLHLTPQGKELTEKSREIQEKYWKRLSSGLSETEIRTLGSLLKKMGDYAYEIKK